MKNLQKFIMGWWVALSILFAFPAITSANGNLTIVVKTPNPYTGNQSWFTYEKKAGEAIQDIAVVKNLSNVPIKAHVYAVDATSNDSGSFILRLENEERTGIGKWTQLKSNDIVTIPPQQSVDFPFRIQLPKDITPGQYFGGIILEEISEAPQTINVASAATNNERICCTNILVKTRIGLRIYLTIPGIVRDKLDWSNLKMFQRNKTTGFQLEMKNSGNVALLPTATIEIFDGMGNQIDRFQRNLGESLPGTSMNPIITWDNKPLWGNFKAVVSLNYQIKKQGSSKALHGSAEAKTKTINFNVIPWNLIIVALAGLAVLGTGLGIHRYNHLRINTTWEPYIIQPNDNIMNIATAHNVDWKKITHINKIKPPYLLTPGEKLLVPKKTIEEQTAPSDEKHA